MPNRNIHLTTSSLSGMLVGTSSNYKRQLAQKQLDPSYEISQEEIIKVLTLSGLAGAIGGALPDIIEPATSPNHRSVFHSVILLVGILGGIFTILSLSEKTGLSHDILAALLGGYGTHQILDATTPKGLPLIS